MFWFLFLAQGFLPLLLCALFLGVKEYILGFAFLNICYQILQIVVNLYFPSSQIAGFKLIGLGFASVLLFFVPSWILGIFNVAVSLSGKLYLMFESLQMMTMVFQASRKMKEKMDSRPSFWGTLIITLTLVNVILTILYDYHLNKSFSTTTTSNYDTSVLKIFLMTIYALQAFAICFTLWKANYDSVILNSAAFAFYLSLKCYQIFRRRDVLESSCLLKNYTSLNGVAKVLFTEREMYSQKGLEVLKSCINTDIINSLVIPTSVFMILPATIKEWKLFWSGDRTVENGESKNSQIVVKLSQILSILAFTDILVGNEHSVSFNYINIITGSIFFVLKVIVADVYTH